MSILTIAEYKLIDEEVINPDEMFKRAKTLLIDLGSEELLAHRFAWEVENDFEGATSISFISAYKNYVAPQSLAGVAFLKWTLPDEDMDYLAPSDFCIPLFMAQKALPMFSGASDAMEEFIRLEAEAKHYAYELEESMK